MGSIKNRGVSEFYCHYSIKFESKPVKFLGDARTPTQGDAGTYPSCQRCFAATLRVRQDERRSVPTLLQLNPESGRRKRPHPSPTQSRVRATQASPPFSTPLPPLRAVLQFFFVDLLSFGPAFTALQKDGIEESGLFDTNALALPEFQHSQKSDDDYQAGTFVFEQFR
jgi:hypothetical protein